ncbi:MAG: M48 family metallopeptidase, partial [Deltaproteobacteria bacterium]|nr:M48 family metallopeptidase [Deltaproteobacteria bacterium]
MAAPHLYDQISRNKRNTYFLILGVIALFVFVGYLIGRFFYGDPFFGVVPALLGSLVYSLFSLFVGDKVVLFMMGAKPAEPGANQQLMNVVEEMAIAAGLKPPKVFVIHSPASNAFATGRSPDKASIAITTGLMERLNREELQAVIGHEMGHIKNFDTRFAILMAVLVGAVAMICDMVMRQMRFGGRRRGQGGGQLQIVMILLAVVLAILAPLVAKMIQFAMSRHRELLADNTAVELTRNPNALANALEKIATDPDELQLANRGTQHLFIVNPLRA